MVMGEGSRIVRGRPERASLVPDECQSAERPCRQTLCRNAAELVRFTESTELHGRTPGFGPFATCPSAGPAKACLREAACTFRGGVYPYDQRVLACIHFILTPVPMSSLSFSFRVPSSAVRSALLIVCGLAGNLPAAEPVGPAAAPPPATAAMREIVRIKAGISYPLTDAKGVTWEPDQGFIGGDTTERPDDMEIANTQTPSLYRSERYDMSGFSRAVPNGRYVVKLHFAETFDEITGPGERVFSFNVEGHEFKNFDVFAKAGGARRAYVESIAVDVADGKLDISFTPSIQSPEINAIEIIPAT